MKKIKYVGEKRKHLSMLYQIRNAIVTALDVDDPVKYNMWLDKMRKELNALEAA